MNKNGYKAALIEDEDEDENENENENENEHEHEHEHEHEDFRRGLFSSSSSCDDADERGEAMGVLYGMARNRSSQSSLVQSRQVQASPVPYLRIFASSLLPFASPPSARFE